MKNISLKICLLLVCSIVKAQEIPTFESINYAPKTPEAATFLKYGEYPVNLSTGVPSISIPLYTIGNGDFTIPISLDYHASGIKVNQEATWVGLGWNLNVVPCIVLSARDGIDENNPQIASVPDANEIIQYWSENPYNYPGPPNSFVNQSRVKDIYYFSSPTGSCNFYIRNREQNDIVVFPPDAFKVEFGNAQDHLIGLYNVEFKVTDKFGNLYVFKEVKEISSVTMTHSDYYTSAWYASEIRTPMNKKILFNYQNDGTLNEFSHYEKIEVIKQQTVDGRCQPIEFNKIGILKNEDSMTRTVAKKIKEIIFNDGNSRVLFEKENGREDLVGSAENGYLKFLKIQQKDPTTGLFVTKKGYEFLTSYFITPQTSTILEYQRKRLRLDKVIDLLDGTGTSFQYSQTVLPHKKSKSIDYYGYFNNASNLDLIPKHYLYPYGNIGSADRRINANYVDAAMLTEITYPTQGRTKFTYEPNNYYGIDELSKYNRTIISGHLVQGTGSGTNAPNESLSPIDETITICNSPNPINCVQYGVFPFEAVNAKGRISFRINNQAGSDPTLVKHQYARVRVFDASGLKYDFGKTTNSGETTREIEVDGSCKIVLEAYGSYMSISNMQFAYTNYDLRLKNVLASGVRIKKIESFDSGAIPVSIKEYRYYGNEHDSRSSGVITNPGLVSFTSPTYRTFSYFLAACDSGYSWPGYDVVSKYSIQSISRESIESNMVVYKNVIEYSLDKNNNQNGYTQYEFTTPPDELPFGDNSVQISNAWKRGQLLEKNDYRKVGQNYLLLKKEKNTYVEDNRKISFINGFKNFNHAYIPETTLGNNINNTSLFFQLVHANGVLNMPSTAIDANEPLNINIPVLWFYRSKSESNEYFYDSNNLQNGFLKKETNYYYDNPVHLQLTRTETTSSGNETSIKKNYYPHDLNEPFMDHLILQNRVSEVIKQEDWKNGSVISTSKRLYENWGNNMFSAKSVQSAKGDQNTETKFTYDKIDNQNGNLQQLTQENGKPISIIWGYNNTLAVAKVENAAYSSIAASSIADIQSKSNTGTEAELTAALNSLRSSLPNAMVTTYTYKPLVGVTSITDPKGMKTAYEYDTFGRLKAVYDSDGNLLSENEYKYRQN